MRASELPTPCYLVDESLIRKNLECLKGVMDRTGCKILLAQKAFSMFALYPLIGEYLCGTTASGLYEARLGAEEMGRENHIFSPAYREDEFDEITRLCDHIVFNTPEQIVRFGKKAKAAGRSIGLRINPECSTQEGYAIYNPCSPGSRLGTTLANFREELLCEIEGLHFHTLCEQNSDALVTTLAAVEEKFGSYLGKMKWINFGGGHHITKENYDISALENEIMRIQECYGVQVYIEPGEAVALNAGFLYTTVLETMKNEISIGILDVSAACHMPDVLEMPYRPPLINSGKAGEKAYTFRLAGPTCLAGDVIGDYSFDRPLKKGDRLIFEDMAIYSMVKNNTFNGMALPAIALRNEQRDCSIIRQFGYEDFKNKLS
ncbi:MAG: carboxynorspermidine decarboxylase [Clostridia bacterium]|jgi:carboxynorspermidine decarboxylase|nr:carboxynorspermidine decarboxylase [Clostridia bacterium]